ncbi:hypothetical protein FGG08_007600, partial [Glutinoglossum americanum]
RQKQPIPHVPDARLDHPPPVNLVVDGADPQLGALGPLPGGAAQAGGAAQHADDEHAAHAPLAEGLDGGLGGAAGGDDGVEEDCEVGGCRVGGVVGGGGGGGGGGGVVREVVV